MNKLILIGLGCAMSACASATVISNFQSDTVGTEPTGWINGPGWLVASDPENASNHVLNTQGLGGNQIAATAGFVGATDTQVLEFDFYFDGSADTDISLGMTEDSLATLEGLLQNNSSYMGPMIRLRYVGVDAHVDMFQGDGSGGGTFTYADQPIETATWYTIRMTIDNQANTSTFSIVGGDYLTPTELTSNTGSVSSYGFRTDGTSDLINFSIRANGNNVGANGILIDNISVIPEPGTYALLFSVLALGLGVYLRRRS